MNVSHLTDGTPVAIVDDFAFERRAEIVKLAIDSSTRTRSAGSNNVGGWKSADTFLSWPYPCLGELARAVQARASLPDVADAFGDLQRKLVAQNAKFADWRDNRSLVGWAMVNGKGNYHKWHKHGAHYLVGVYYADPGDPPGPTMFASTVKAPRDYAGSAADQREATIGSDRWLVPAVAGRLVFFPGATWHRVPPYLGETPRVTVAFEIR